MDSCSLDTMRAYRVLEILELHWPGIEEGVRRVTGGYVRMDFLCETIKAIINYFPR